MATSKVVLAGILAIWLMAVLAESSATKISIPATPTVDQQHRARGCQLEMSEDMFGGVREACGSDNEKLKLDRNKCCPVLGAWLYAAHARSALNASLPSFSEPGDRPAVPEDSQGCINTLQRSLERHGITLNAPNSSCDVFFCYCGIRLHSLSFLTCPNAFNVSSNNGTLHHVSPLPPVKALESNCTGPSYAGCSRCLSSLTQIKGLKGEGEKYKRECEIMGLTWLLFKNKTEFIPTVSAVLRALLYSPGTDSNESVCRRDDERMPVAMNVLSKVPRQVETNGANVGSRAAFSFRLGFMLVYFLFIVSVLNCS